MIPAERQAYLARYESLLAIEGATELLLIGKTNCSATAHRLRHFE
jgi:hypothetical protein